MIQTFKQWRNKFEVCDKIPNGYYCSPLDNKWDVVCVTKKTMSADNRIPMSTEALTALRAITDYFVDENHIEDCFLLERKSVFVRKVDPNQV